MKFRKVLSVRKVVLWTLDNPQAQYYLTDGQNLKDFHMISLWVVIRIPNGPYGLKASPFASFPKCSENSNWEKSECCYLTNNSINFLWA